MKYSYGTLTGKTQQNKQGLLFSKWGSNGDLVSPLSQGPQNFMTLLVRLFLVLSPSYPKGCVTALVGRSDALYMATMKGLPYKQLFSYSMNIGLPPAHLLLLLH